MTTYLLITAVVIFACVFLSKVSSRLGIPMLLAFILLGMLFGSDGILKIPFDNYAFAEQICTVALIFIMFYGGFGTNWQQAKSVAVKAGLLSTAGVVITAALTGVFCHYALHIAWVESMLIGALIGSTDAASVFSVLRSKRLSLRYNTASLLEVESGSNDPCAYMLTVTFIAIAQGSASGGQIGLLIVKQMLFGILFGGLIAAAAVLLLKKIKFSTAGFDMVFVVGIAVIGYALPAVFGGNGFLSVYIAGIVLGNTEIRNKRNLVNFFDGLTGLMQMLIFFLLGLLAFPSRLPQVVIPALLIAVFLTFVARPDCVLNLENALYAYGYIKKKPYGWRLAVDKNTSKSRFKMDYPKIIPMYAEPETLELGVTEIQFSDVTVRIFEKERLICECLKYEDKMDRERFKEGLMAYIKDPKKDIAKLMYYAKERKVVKKVQNMIGVWL